LGPIPQIQGGKPARSKILQVDHPQNAYVIKYAIVEELDILRRRVAMGPTLEGLKNAIKIFSGMGKGVFLIVCLIHIPLSIESFQVWPWAPLRRCSLGLSWR
jgi:hypothetical protein